MLSQFAIGLRNRFRDYFFPEVQSGRMGSMMQIEDYIEDFINSYTENTYKMTIDLIVDNAQLVAINNMMQHLDTVVFINQPRNLKPIISICLEVRVKLLQKAIKNREKAGTYKIKLSYYMADALWIYLTTFKVILDLGVYEENVWQRITNQLHEKLQ